MIIEPIICIINVISINLYHVFIYIILDDKHKGF